MATRLPLETLLDAPAPEPTTTQLERKPPLRAPSYDDVLQGAHDQMAALSATAVLEAQREAAADPGTLCPVCATPGCPWWGRNGGAR